jgi:hypothetical protein
VLLPAPTVELVKSEGFEFDRDPSIRLTEDALAQLWVHFPRNVEPPHVLLKVLALNQLYNTRIRSIDVEHLARHIAGLGIDTLLADGSARAVDLIVSCDGLPKYYSFATKFCSWHNSSAYPIHDGNVDECLWSYRKQDKFAKFRRKDLMRYESFFAIVTAFRTSYGLDSLSFKELDKFLWRAGERLLKEASG